MENQENINAENQGEIKDSPSIAAIRPFMFKKGQSGNPAGKPKGCVSFKEYLDKIGRKKAIDVMESRLIPMAMKEALREFIALDPDITLKEATSYVTYMNALLGDSNSRDFVADRSEGKAIQVIQELPAPPIDEEAINDLKSRLGF
ncbi:MAG TPA: DUF5681 domain-containing protein [Methanosarcina sp.]|nr:DUF5681 domain-containing protein [Methanosarcina sp.]